MTTEEKKLKKALFQTKRIWYTKTGVKVTFPTNHTQEPVYGKQARLYGSSRILYSHNKHKHYVETDNIVLVDGVRYE